MHRRHALASLPPPCSAGGVHRIQAAVQGHRPHRRRLRQGFPADRPQRPATQPEGFQGQGGRDVLRLHPVPRCLPHLDGRVGRGQKAAGRGWRQGPGRVRHRGSGARHAARCSRPTWPTSIPASSRCAARRSNWPRWPRISRSTTRRWKARRPPATPWTTPPPARLRHARPPAPVHALRHRSAGPGLGPATAAQASLRKGMVPGAHRAVCHPGLDPGSRRVDCGSSPQ